MRRGFVEADGRLVHYRRIGRGPALVLLHGSPNSSRALSDLMTALSSRFDCIAPDTPGNGLSDPLADPEPTTGDYAQALKKTADALGLSRFSLYGFHTGAGTAAEFMARWPERVAGAVLEGVAAWTEDEKAGMLQGYLPPFEPKWDGSHLAWLWARVTAQSMFFPWHRPSRETRLDLDLHPPETLHRTAMEFLAAGDNYRKPYAAALAGDGAARARRVSTPTLVTAHPRDPIAHHLDRLEALHPSVVLLKETREDRSAIWSDFGRFLERHPGDSVGPLTAATTRGFVETDADQTLWRSVRAGRDRPLALLHGAGQSSHMFAECLASIADKRPVIALDLSGHGDSDCRGPMAAKVEDFADRVGAALDALGVENPDVAGFHLGGAVAVELKRRGGAHAAALIGAPAYSTQERRAWRGRMAPDLSVRADGAHLLAAWRFALLSALYDPWFLTASANTFRGEPQIHPMRLHRRTVEALKAGRRVEGAFEAQLDYSLAAHMDQAEARLVLAAEGDPLSAEPRLNALRAACKGPLDVVSLPADPANWGPSLLRIGR
jgi:pimeloyl-ACP methyl ester carboxylesterase